MTENKLFICSQEKVPCLTWISNNADPVLDQLLRCFSCAWNQDDSSRMHECRAGLDLEAGSKYLTLAQCAQCGKQELYKNGEHHHWCGPHWSFPPDIRHNSWRRSQVHVFVSPTLQVSWCRWFALARCTTTC